MALNSQRMNLDYIRTFVVLGQSRNMTEASQKLNVTISYVSRHIRQLEEELNTKLIIPSPKNRDLQLTESGIYFFKKYEKLYNEILLTEKNYKQLKHLDNCKLTIGINSDLDDAFLKSKLEKFVKKFPKINLKVIHGDTEMLLKRLKQYSVDVIIYKVNSNRIYDFDSLQQVHLMKSYYCFTYNPLKFHYESLSQAPVIIPTNSIEDRTFFDHFFKKNNYNFKVIYEFDTFEDMKSSIFICLGLCILLEPAICDHTFLKQERTEMSADINLSYVKEMVTPSTIEFLKLFKIDIY